MPQFSGFELKVSDAARNQASRRLDERAFRRQVHYTSDMSRADTSADTAHAVVVYPWMAAPFVARHRENHVRVRGLYLRMRVRPVSP